LWSFPINQTGIEIVCRSLDLNQDPSSLLDDMQSLTNQLAAEIP
jgi:hypothetical protein